MARKGIYRGVTQRKNRKGWWLRIYLNGRERWFRCDSKSQAVALRGRLKAEAREGKYFERSKAVPFREIATEYMEAVDAHRKRKGDDRSRVSRWVQTFGDQDAATICPRQVERVLTVLQTEGKQPATLVRHLTVLKAIFNRAKRLSVLKDNPATRVQSPKVNNVLVRYLTQEQERTLLAVLPARFRPVVTTALNTGLRQSELLRLTWRDVDWNVGVLTVTETKAGDQRRLPMNSLVQGVLAELKVKAHTNPTERIFGHDARYLRRTFDRAVKQAGLSPFRFHDLRHTFASRLAMNGANDRTIMALGGWKSPRMLDRYAHLGPTHLWQAVEGLSSNRTVAKTVTRQDEESGEGTQLLKKIGAGKGI